MKPLSQYKTETIQLVQPSIWKRIYHLLTADAVLLTMTYPKLFSSLVIVEGFGEIWEFRKPQWWRSNLEIKKQHNQLPFAKFIVGKWGKGGMFELPNGERIEYVYEVWKNKNEIFSQQKVRLISLDRGSLFKTSLSVIIEHESVLLDKNPWIIMAVYSQMLERRQAAHAAM